MMSAGEDPFGFCLFRLISALSFLLIISTISIGCSDKPKGPGTIEPAEGELRWRSGVFPGDLPAIWDDETGATFSVGGSGGIFHFDGISCEKMEVQYGYYLHDIDGRSKRDVHVVKINRTVLHYDGYRWQTEPIDTWGNIFGLWYAGRDIYSAVGSNGVIIHYDGIEWRGMESGTTEPINSVWGTSADKILASVGDYRGDILEYVP